MKTLVFRVLPVVIGASALIVLMFSGVRAPGKGPVRQDLAEVQAKELERFQGTWNLVKITNDDVERPNTSEYYRKEFKGHRVSVDYKLKDGRTHKGTVAFTVNPLKSPSELTEHGDYFLLQMIYRLEGDKLTIAFFNCGELDRPISFDFKKNPDNGLFLNTWTFERVKN
jgi:uncharacterized protein (TIGR03067 family)